jgi:hypothetical protein
MKLISFLGTTPYRSATYVHAGQEYASRFFPVIAARIYQPDEVLLVMTQGAYATHFESITDELQPIAPVKPVLIPDGKKQDELWEIFDILTDTLNVGDEAIFDITLGFRSIPIMAVIAAAFWRVAKGVNVKHLIYGALESVDEQGRSSIFDLTPMLNLMEWTVATDAFLKTGNATQLSQLLKDAHSVPHRHAGGKKGTNLPRHLQNAADAIDAVSQSMRLVRPHTLSSEAGRLDRNLSLVRQEVGQWAKPFASLLDRTQTAYQSFALEQPHANLSEYLRMQLDLVAWYLDKQLIVQAYTLAREWLVSLLIMRLGWDLIDDREYAETLLNTGFEAYIKKRSLPPPLQKVPQVQDLLTTWDWLRDLRNDIAHCGMRRQPRPNGALLNSAGELLPKLTHLFQE